MDTGRCIVERFSNKSVIAFRSVYNRRVVSFDARRFTSVESDSYFRKVFELESLVGALNFERGQYVSSCIGGGIRHRAISLSVGGSRLLALRTSQKYEDFVNNQHSLNRMRGIKFSENEKNWGT